jgi:hypothetical protein
VWRPAAKAPSELQNERRRKRRLRLFDRLQQAAAIGFLSKNRKIGTDFSVYAVHPGRLVALCALPADRNPDKTPEKVAPGCLTET